MINTIPQSFSLTSLRFTSINICVLWWLLTETQFLIVDFLNISSSEENWLFSKFYLCKKVCKVFVGFMLLTACGVGVICSRKLWHCSVQWFFIGPCEMQSPENSFWIRMCVDIFASFVSSCWSLWLFHFGCLVHYYIH